jgi:hypothetical protein
VRGSPGKHFLLRLCRPVTRPFAARVETPPVFSDGIRLSLQCGTKDGRICRSRQLPYIIIVESGYSTDASSPTPGPSKQHRTVLLTLQAGGTPQRAYQHDSPRRLFCNPCAPRGDIIRRCGCVYGDNFYFARPALKAKQVDAQEPAKLRRGDYVAVSPPRKDFASWHIWVSTSW